MSASMTVALCALAFPAAVAVAVGVYLGASVLLERAAERLGLPGAVGFFLPPTILMMAMGGLIGASISGLLP